jgi:uncharacterized protein YggU (UPF0235/DUF167 family)
MRLFVTVKTRAQEEHVEAVDTTHFIVSVKAAPIDGEANRAIQRALANHLGITMNRLALRAGVTGKRKVFDYETA